MKRKETGLVDGARRLLSKLKIAGADVVGDGETGDVLRRVSKLDTPARLADDHDKLDLQGESGERPCSASGREVGGHRRRRWWLG